MSGAATRRLVLGLLLSVCAAGANAADEVAWTGSVGLAELLDAPTSVATAGDTSLAICAGLFPDGEFAALQARAAEDKRRLLIAEKFFRAFEAEEQENLGTERVAASFGRFTRAAESRAATAGALELAYQQTFNRREAARKAHHEARRQLGASLGATEAVGKALDAEALEWPAPPVDSVGKVTRQALLENPELRALQLLNTSLEKSRTSSGSEDRQAACQKAAASQLEELRREVAAAVPRHHRVLRLALDSRRKAARLQLARAESTLDRVRDGLAQGHGAHGPALHEAQIATAEAVASLNHLKAEAVLSSLHLQALQGQAVRP